MSSTKGLPEDGLGTLGGDEDLAIFRASVRTMVDRDLRRVLGGAAADEPVPKETLRSCLALLAPLGYAGIRLPEAEGGSGLAFRFVDVLMEGIPPFLAVALIAQEASIFRLFTGGSPALRQRYLPSLIAGESIAGSAISEPGIGSNSNGVATSAEVVGANCWVRGTKQWVSNGAVADLLVVLARDTTSGRLVRVVVDTGETPVQARALPMSGLARGYLAEVVLDVCVPVEHVLVDEAGGDTIMQRSWMLNRVAMGCVACGIGQSAVDYAIEYAKSRTQFGRPIGAFQLVQALLADAATSVEAGRQLCHAALRALDVGGDADRLVSMAKLFCTEAGIQAVLKAQQVIGAYGVSRDLPFDGWLRDARMLTFPDGTSQIQQLIIGRSLLGMSAFR